jgi:exosortase B
MERATYPEHPAAWREWWPVIVGLAVLYVPTLRDLATGIWNTEEQGHGPLILAAVLYLLWQQREILTERPQQAPSILAGGTLLLFGLLLYAIGRSQEILIFEVGSLLPVIAGTLWLLRGRSAVKRILFPLFFIVFMLPLPGFLVDAMTGLLKQQVSVAAEHLLYAAGYPVGRAGVTLQIGPYRLLVADACSGLHSIFSLLAIGLLYVYLAGYSSWPRRLLLLATIIPVAFSANVIRVMLLAMITYHFGDKAGQGFLHGAAGIVMFVVALTLFFTLDGLLALVFRKPPAE